MNTSDDGGLWPRDPCGLSVLWWRRQLSMDHVGFRERVEDLPVEQLFSESCVEALDEAVLPRAARRDVSGLGPDGRDPVLHGLGEEPGPLSERMYSGAPRRMNRSDSTSITSTDLITARPGSPGIHGYSSMRLSIRYFLPSCVRSSTKS
jgi:hypothetical protein